MNAWQSYLPSFQVAALTIRFEVIALSREEADDPCAGSSPEAH